MIMNEKLGRGYDDITEERVAENLERSGDQWKESARLGIKSVESLAMQTYHDVYPGQSPEVEAMVGGITEHLYKISADYAYVDEKVVGEAWDLFDRTVEQHHSSAFMAEFAIALANRDKIDLARQLMIMDGPVVEEYQPYVYCAIAESHVRQGDDKNAFECMVTALCTGHSINNRNSRAFEKVLQAKVSKDLGVDKEGSIPLPELE